MAEVSRIQGPGGTPEHDKGKKVQTDSEKFKEAMKIQKIREVDPEEQKKRKRREEAEEEDEVQGPAPTTPPGHVAPFEEKTKEVSPLDLQKAGKAAPSPIETAQPTKKGAQAAQPIKPFAAEEAAEVPPEQPVATPPAPPQQPVPMPTVQQPAVTPLSPPQAPQPPTERAPAAKKPEANEPTPIAPPAEAGRGEQKEKFFEQFAKGKKTEEEMTEEAAATAVAPPSPVPGAPESKKAEKQRAEEIAEAGGVGPATTELPPSTDISQIQPMAMPSYAYLHPQVMELFERMVGVMTVMDMNGVRETTVTLNAPQFSSSVFYGAQIIIQEYTTAPKVFNIQMVGSPQAVALFQANADDLMAAFQSGKYNFRVNRLEASLSERPLIRRKEGPGKEKEKEKGK